MSREPSRGGLSADDALPPVEPPSAGFIVQLFVVPGVIVLAVVLIWILFNWLAQKGNDREAFVRALSRNNEARWQAAFNLAHELRADRNGRNPELINDPELARQLAEILKREIEAGSMEQNSIELRIYLSRALGEFIVPDGMTVLLQAATTNRDECETDVRRAALEGIALLAVNVGRDNPQIKDNEKLAAVLLEAASDSDARTRSVATVGLGVIGAPAMIDKLTFLLEDLNPDVRYNAATRLAVLGEAAAIPVLVEMLDPNETAGVDAEKVAEMKAFKQAQITVNALRAAGQLASANLDVDLAELQTAIEKLLASEPSSEVRVVATDALRRVKERPEPAAVK